MSPRPDESIVEHWEHRIGRGLDGGWGRRRPRWVVPAVRWGLAGGWWSAVGL